MESYTPREINFDFHCVKWVWENIHTFQSGEWPDISPSGYYNLSGLTQQISARPKFENPCLVAAEVEIRAKRCGLDSFLVTERYIRGLTEEVIARERHLTLEVIYRKISLVLGYSASGRVPRWFNTRWKRSQTYKEWCDAKGYRKSVIVSNMSVLGNKT